MRSSLTPEVSFVTVTWNCADEFAALLESLESHLDREFEVVVVDNDSSDNIHEVTAGHDRVRLIEPGENLGFGAANNIGVLEARAPVTVLINPDTYVLDDSILKLCDRAATRSALFGPRVLNVDLTIQPSASPSPGSTGSAFSALWPSRLAPQRVRLSVEPWRSSTSRNVGWLTGVCLVGQTELLRQLGPFDTTIHMYSEDLELGMRASSLDIPSVFAPDVARIVHIGDASSSKRYSDSGKKLSVQNRFAAIVRHRGRLAAVLDLLAFSTGMALRLVAKKAIRRDAGEELGWLRAVARRS